MHKQSYDFLLFYNILNKIIKRREEKATVAFLWTCNSVMTSKLTTAKTINKPKIVSSFTNKLKFY